MGPIPTDSGSSMVYCPWALDPECPGFSETLDPRGSEGDRGDFGSGSVCLCHRGRQAGEGGDMGGGRVRPACARGCRV